MVLGGSPTWSSWLQEGTTTNETNGHATRQITDAADVVAWHAGVGPWPLVKNEACCGPSVAPRELRRSVPSHHHKPQRSGVVGSVG